MKHRRSRPPILAGSATKDHGRRGETDTSNVLNVLQKIEKGGSTA